MKKQTAVEWLYNTWVNYPGLGTYEEIQEWVKQAKAMEKEQIVDAHLTGLIRPLEMEATKQSVEYYNETYGGDK